MVGLAVLAVLPIPGQYYITRYCSYSFWSEASFCKNQHWLLAFPASLKAAFFISQNPRKISFLQLPTISQHSINKTNNSSRYFSFTFFPENLCKMLLRQGRGLSSVYCSATQLRFTDYKMFVGRQARASREESVGGVYAMAAWCWVRAQPATERSGPPCTVQWTPLHSNKATRCVPPPESRTDY